MAESITWPESDWACISLAEDKSEGKMPQEQAGTEDSCSRGLAAWQSITRDETQRLVMSMCSRLQAVIDCKVFATKYYKVKVWFMIVSLSHYFRSLKKWEAHIETVVIPTPFTWFGCKYPQIKAESLHIKHILFVSFQMRWELCRCPNIYGPDCSVIS